MPTEEQSNPMRNIVLGTAVAIGASAFLHKTGKIAALSRHLDKGYRMLSDGTRLVGRALDKQNVNIEDFKKLNNNLRNRWQEIKSNDKIRISRDPQNFAGHIMQYLDAMNSAEKAGFHVYTQNHLLAPELKEIADHKKLTHNQKKRLENLTKTMVKNVEESGTTQWNIIRQSKELDDDALKFAIQIRDRITQKHFKAKQDGTIDQIKNNVVKGVKNTFQKTIHDIAVLKRDFSVKHDPYSIKEMTGDHAMTIGEVLTYQNNLEKRYGKKMVKEKSFHYDLIKEIENLRNDFVKKGQEKDFDNLLFDGEHLRISSKGEMYSTDYIRKAKYDLQSIAANTLPGKLFKLRDIAESMHTPSINLVHAGSFDPVLSTMTNEDKYKNTHFMQHTMMQVKDDFYFVDETTGNVTKSNVSGKLVGVSGRYGNAKRMMKTIAGDNKVADDSNFLFKYLDIWQDREIYSGDTSEEVLSKLTKIADKNWRGNWMKDLLHPSAESRTARQKAIDEHDDSFMYEQVDRLKQVQKLFKENVYDLSDEALDAIMGKMDKTSESYRLMQASRMHNEELWEYAVTDPDNLLFNIHEDVISQDLKDFLSRIANDNIDSRNTLYLKTDRTRVSAPGGSLFGILNPVNNNETADAFEILRAEMQKEALIRYKESHGYSFDAVVDLVSDLGISGENQKNTDRLAMLAYLQDKTELAVREFDKKTGLIKNAAPDFYDENFQQMLNGNSKADKKFQKTFDFLIDEEVSITESSFVSEVDRSVDTTYNKIIYVRKSTDALSIVSEMNNAIKNFMSGNNDMSSFINSGGFNSTYNTAKSYFSQFNAGRDNLDEVTQATLYPMFMLTRLSDDMNRAFGLGFSSASTTNLSGMAKAIAFKRIMPAYLGYNMLDWTDDTTQELTGNSVTGYMANGLANVDLASRKVLDSFGITEWLNEEKSINPIMQYWGEKTPFMNYDERKKYYESGYDPVRKGSWWTFGGVQEARGGEISYFTPSFARRIKSDWKDESLYDGYFDKWSHSWLPTPTNPLSPLFALANPYWLEEKHADDRPYALSGQLFEENTPWGAILNPTIGEIIKPQIEMHPWRLQGGVDVKALLSQMNENIHNWARDAGELNIIGIKNNVATPSTFVSYNAPTPDTKVRSAILDPDNFGNVDYEIRDGVYGAPSDISTNVGGYGTNISSGTIQSLGGIGGGGTLSTDGSPSGNVSFAGAGGAAGNSKGTPYGFVSLKDRPDLLFNFKSQADDPNILQKILTGNTNYPLQGDIVSDSKGNLGIYATRDKEISDKELEKRTSIDNGLTGTELYAATKNDLKLTGQTKKIIAAINQKINGIDESQNELRVKTGTPINEEDGFLMPEKLKTWTPSQGMELLNNPDSVAELINAGKGADFIREAESSQRLITGIYGYMNAEALGIGVYNDKTITTGQDITSTSRAFWDMGWGGFGGDTMEIVRRFIPEFKRGNRINPLMNEMPDWLPERFRFGDPFTIIENGEMRLPGKGYETLNDLHPDMYGIYGSFDRFKILADIAPFTPEYKLWKNIAEKTVMDPALQEEMKEIRHRTALKRQKHDFYDYKVVGKSLEYEQIDVSEIMNYGKFRSGSTLYKLAGVKILGNEQENMQDVLNRYIHPGQTITVAYDSIEANEHNNDAMRTVNAAVYIDGENLAEMMIERGDAKRKENDTSTPATLGRYSSGEKMLGYFSEIVAHADVPWLNDQFLRVRTPLESYKAEQVYGTPYQSWSNPIGTFLEPAIERAIQQPIYYKAIFKELASDTSKMTKWEKNIVNLGWAFADRGAFIGAAVIQPIKPNTGSVTKTMMKIGSNLTTVAHFANGGNSMADEAATGAYLAKDIAEFLDPIHFKSKAMKTVAAGIGAAVGITYRGIAVDKDPWIPERVQNNWELEDYFDRLTYLKYMGLYHAAAEKAKEEEGVDVEDIVERQENRINLVNNIRKKLTNIKKAMQASHEGMDYEGKTNFIKTINQKLDILDDEKSLTVEGGKWTHSALLYKQAADSTVFGLNKNSSWTQMVTALPTNDREYFMEFVKERDPDKRNEILSYASPFMQKALKLAWNDDSYQEEDMESFMMRHDMPGEDWAGWLPQIDLKDVEIKTIMNEGMNLSDFGFYDSQARDPNVLMAPELEAISSPAEIKGNIERVLRGRRLEDVDINVTTANNISGTQIMTDIGIYTGVADMQRRVDESLNTMSY